MRAPGGAGGQPATGPRFIATVARTKPGPCPASLFIRHCARQRAPPAFEQLQFSPGFRVSGIPGFRPLCAKSSPKIRSALLLPLFGLHGRVALPRDHGRAEARPSPTPLLLPSVLPPHDPTIKRSNGPPFAHHSRVLQARPGQSRALPLARLTFHFSLFTARVSAPVSKKIAYSSSSPSTRKKPVGESAGTATGTVASPSASAIQVFRTVHSASSEGAQRTS